jgi:hypothetical protein
MIVLNRRTLITCFTVLPAAAAIARAFPADAAGTSDTLELITPQDAKLGAFTGDPLAITRSFGDPLINVVTPSLDIAAPARLTSPVAIYVKLEPSAGAEIDPMSLKVTYLKMWGIDLTGKIRPYLKEREIKADKVKIAKGNHTLRVEISDTRGRKAATEFSFVIDNT